MGLGPFTGAGARAGLYAAALAVFIGSSVVGSGSTPDEPIPAQASSEQSEEAAEQGTPVVVDPFLQDEVTFRYLPDVRQLLLGDAGIAEARALMVVGCEGTNLNLGEATVPEVAMVASSPTTATQKPEMTVDTVVSVPDDSVACSPRIVPVTWQADMRVRDSGKGWLLATPTDPKTVTPDVATVPYVVKRIISPGGYALLALTALAIACAGPWRREGTDYADKRQDQQADPGKGGSDETIPSLPLMATISAALAAVTTGLSTVTGLVPGLDLGGVAVSGLLAAVLVAVGDRLSLTYGESAWRANLGLFLSLFGTAAMAMLIPFVLLHGANIGGWSAVVWGATAACLMAASRFRLPKPDQQDQGIGN